MAADVTAILKADKEKKLITGFKESLKALKTGKAHEVFVTKNCSEIMKKQVMDAVQLAGAKMVELSQASDELSAQLKKPYNITVLAIMSK